PCSLPVRVGEQHASAQPPELVATDRDQDDYDNDGEDGVGVAAPVGDIDQVSQAALGIDDLGQNDPAPAHAIHASQMVPDVGLGDREQDVAYKLPLRRAFGNCTVRIGRRNVG